MSLGPSDEDHRSGSRLFAMTFVAAVVAGCIWLYLAGLQVQ